MVFAVYVPTGITSKGLSQYKQAREVYIPHTHRNASMLTLRDQVCVRVISVGRTRRTSFQFTAYKTDTSYEVIETVAVVLDATKVWWNDFFWKIFSGVISIPF